ncbi:MAG: FdtA/QdtA family cupin domain-containing protein [Holosporaceae bacterium]|jgi:dTDP-4-dehydrorhamnose 3,5-epimerase-like enzyme|nr:FdtA/QdtA family cupin domain-containing protein [Holosporaceae bacterium]
MKKYRIINLDKHEDSRGKLIAFEKGVNCPFEIKRAFFMYDGDINSVRGAHANKKSQFLLIAIKGSCQINVNDGINSDSFVLDSSEKALYLDRMVWKEMVNFSENAIILVLSSEKYDASEYVARMEISS